MCIIIVTRAKSICNIFISHIESNNLFNTRHADHVYKLYQRWELPYPQPLAWRWWFHCHFHGPLQWRPPPRCCTDGSCSGWGCGRKTHPGPLQTRCSPEGERLSFNFGTKGITSRSRTQLFPTREHCWAQHVSQNKEAWSLHSDIHMHERARQSSFVNKRLEGTQRQQTVRACDVTL